ncbi:TetR family transcriptional regulator [Geminicoccus roseus]|uniref:TetR family transcriptional regulator n=1 Tax=Geminicoccus roseus TaxID=404900 RepID=UPI000405313C|nr:TetR family transcriptional regulator [Geminicoccus roseus]
MARKPKAADTAAPMSMRDPLDTALAMIETGGWRGFSLVELARELGVPVGEVYAQFPCRTAVLHELGKRLDSRMLELSAADLDDMSTRDRLFELIMRRFDAMKPYREALRRVAKESRGDLEAAGVGFCNLTRSVVEIVDAAGIRGPAALLARKGVGLLYLRVLRVWMRDEDPEQAKTLAELDQGLARLEQTARNLCRFMPKRRAKEAEPAAV